MIIVSLQYGTFMYSIVTCVRIAEQTRVVKACTLRRTIKRVNLWWTCLFLQLRLHFHARSNTCLSQNIDMGCSKIMFYQLVKMNLILWQSKYIYIHGNIWCLLCNAVRHNAWLPVSFPFYSSWYYDTSKTSFLRQYGLFGTTLHLHMLHDV